MIIAITMSCINLAHLNSQRSSSLSKDSLTSTLIISDRFIDLFHFSIFNWQLFRFELSNLPIYRSSPFMRALLKNHVHWEQMLSCGHLVMSYLEEFYMSISSHCGNQLQNLISLIQLLLFLFILLLYIFEAFYETINAVSAAHLLFIFYIWFFLAFPIRALLEPRPEKIVIRLQKQAYHQYILSWGYER